MKKKIKLLLTLGIIFLSLCIVCCAAIYWFILRPMPRMDGSLKIPGLKEKVTVRTDKWGIPHIYARNEDDLFIAQGYIHAQNRMWQMELNRSQGKGELSRILGRKVIGSDQFLRSFGLRRIAESTWKNIDPDSRAILLAYTEGVNAYLDMHKNNLPIEFVIFGVKPKPWTPVDTLSYGNMMAIWLSGNYRLEYLRSIMIALAGEETMNQLFPPHVKDTPLIIPPETGNYKELAANNQLAQNIYDGWIGDPDAGWGSNNWTVHGSRTKSGKPFLANDMHLALGLPSLWFQNGLHGGRFNCIGFSLTGVPAIIVGYNENIAWGTTNLSPDSQDLYMEELDDIEHPTKYKYKGEWHDLTIIHETIPLKGKKTEPYDILITNHGPILPSILGDDTSKTPLAMRWSIAEENRLFASVVRVNLASNWKEFKEALRLWEIPGQNVVYADREGNIGYQATGKVPIRQKNHNGLLPVPGWTGEYEWTGYIPYDEMPSVLNPSQGFVATANNQVVPDSYPYVITLDWYPGFRAKRIVDLLSASNSLTMDDMKNIQAQTYCIPAETFVPCLLALSTADEQEKRVLQKLKEWDYYVKADSVGAGIYEVWFLYMIKNTVSDELGDDMTGKYLAGKYERHSTQTMPLLLNLMKDEDNILFDNKGTSPRENRDDIIKKSFRDTLDFFTKKVGKDVNKWEWGRVHTMTFRHFPLGSSGIPLLEWLFNSKTYPVGGDHFTVNEEGYYRNQPFEINHGPSQRMIVDLSNFDDSFMTNSTGQTELLWHPNRLDTIPLWVNVEYSPMQFSNQSVEALTRHTLLLLPE